MDVGISRRLERWRAHSICIGGVNVAVQIPDRLLHDCRLAFFLLQVKKLCGIIELKQSRESRLRSNLEIQTQRLVFGFK
jgi:hypothetical protein